VERPALIVAKCSDHQSRTVSYEVRQKPKSQLTMAVQPQRKKCRCLWKIQIRGDNHNEELDSSAKIQMVNRTDDYTVTVMNVRYIPNTEYIPNKNMSMKSDTAPTSGLRKGQRLRNTIAEEDTRKHLERAKESNKLDNSALSTNKRMDRPGYQDSAPNLTQHRNTQKLGKSRESLQTRALQKTAGSLECAPKRTVFLTTLMSGGLAVTQAWL
jgi:hypothetical protein